MKSTIKAFFLCVGVLALLLAVFVFWYGHATGAFIGASDVHVADPTAAVRDARQLIASFRPSVPDVDRKQRLRPDQLPESLRLPKLLYADVSGDHINLVLGRNPDWSVGARVWSADTKTVHADLPTAFSDIFFFQYCNDSPISPENLP